MIPIASQYPVLLIIFGNLVGLNHFGAKIGIRSASVLNDNIGMEQHENTVLCKAYGDDGSAGPCGVSSCNMWALVRTAWAGESVHRYAVTPGSVILITS